MTGLADWQGAVVDALYPLKRYLGAGADSAVYLTEVRSADGPANAAIKLLPLGSLRSERQLEYWRLGADLAHPHLLRLLGCGRCRIEGTELLYVVMEYADENLGEILPIRRLEPDEIRAMLRPALGALSYLHSQGLLQGGLKPTNVLVVADQLKLASDTVRPVDAAVPAGMTGRYDAPEARAGPVSTAADIWALGVTLTQALTGARPESMAEGGRLLRATGVPKDLMQIIEGCLDAAPERRPTVEMLQRWIDHGSPPASQAASPQATRTMPVAADARGGWHSRALLVAGLGLLAAVWLGVSRFHAGRSPRPEAAHPAIRSVAPATPSVPAARAPTAATNHPTPAPTRTDSIAVQHRQMPQVTHSALATIHGRLKVVVWVGLDESGRVSTARLRTPGPSRYFADAALTAARGWQFTPADASHRQCLLHFAFTRQGVSAQDSCTSKSGSPAGTSG